MNVLVTGSSRGIGRAIAQRLAADGWHVILHGSRHSPELESAARELGDHHAGTVIAELSDPGGADKLFELATEIHTLDALVNNAGIYRPLPFLESTDEEFNKALEETFQINLYAPLRLMRLAGMHFRNRGGAILNVASRVGFRGESGASFYSASKAALINLTRALAVEWAKDGIRVFGIAPGWVETAMSRNGMDDRLPEILSGIPLGRMASPQDCANAASFLLDPRSEYLSGEVIDINGASYFH